MPNRAVRGAGADTVAESVDDGLRQAIELMFFAYRDFTGEADEILADYGFGRAHHRAIYFVGRNPGIAVNQLLDILKITKQSLARVLGQLVAEGYIRQDVDPDDGRRRLLSLTDHGTELERLLTGRQGRRIRRAFEAVGAGAGDGFMRVLEEMIDERDAIRLSGEVGGEVGGDG